MAYDDEEQLEAIRNWWQANGRLIVIGAVVALALVLGWQQWNGWQARQAAAATGEYSAVLNALDNGGIDAAANRLQQLREAHAGSPHAALASFAVASAQLAAGNAEEAAATLGWVVETQADSSVAAIARLREAEALTAAGEDEAALQRLEPLPETALRARYLELRGDLELARGNREAAIEAYQRALEGMGGQRRALVEVKLLDLGGAPAS